MPSSKKTLSQSDQALFDAIETLDIVAFCRRFDGVRSASLRDPFHKDRTPLMALAFDQIRGEFTSSRHKTLFHSFLKRLLPVSDVNARDADGCTPLLAAVLGKNIWAINALAPLSDLSARAPSSGMTPLMVAAMGGDAEVVKAILPFSDPAAKDDDGWTALLAAAVRGDVECLRLLIPVSDANAANQQGSTPLMECAMRGRTEAARLLLPHSDVSLVDGDGKTAFMHAISGRNDECVELFESAALNSLDGEGRTPLMRAAMECSRAVGLALLPRSNPNAVDRDGNTALMLSLLHAPNEEFALKLSKVTNPKIINHNGDTALALAGDLQMWKLADFLAPSSTDAEFESMLLALAESAGPAIAARLESLLLRQAMSDAQIPRKTEQSAQTPPSRARKSL